MTVLDIMEPATAPARSKVEIGAAALDQIETLGVQIRQDHPLANLTTIKIGGRADYFAVVTDTHKLLKLVRWARAGDLPYLILGGGSNVLISDRGIRGLVIHNRCNAVQVQDAPCCDYPRDTRPFLYAESGALLAGAARTAINAGLTGLEWAVSVPGSVGGAVVNNAGAHGGEVKDSLWDVLLLDDNGDIQIYRVEDLSYAYRQSSLKREGAADAGFGPVLLSANFRLQPGDRDTIRAVAQSFLGHRRSTQPVEPSLGSTFVNPPGDFAGRLIEEAGLKGFRLGGVEVSRTHANFLINPGGAGAATAADVMAMIEYIQTAVARRSGVALQPELQKIGEW